MISTNLEQRYDHNADHRCLLWRRTLVKKFAAGGDNVVLTARSEDKLKELGNELRQLHNVVVTVIPSDLSNLAEVDRLCDSMRDRGIEIDTVVNNAGFGALGNFLNSRSIVLRTC